MKILGIKSDVYLLWCFAIGFMAACIFVYISKTVGGKLVRALVKEDACDEESAMTLKQLGCKGIFYRMALHKGSVLTRSVGTVDSQDAERRYYLKPEEKEKMLLKYGKNKNSLPLLLLSLLVSLAAAFLLAALLPMAKGFFGKLM